MSRRLRKLVTVSPPTFERTEFAQVDAMLDAPHAPFDREWLMARFDEGLQIRILREPRLGLVLFQPASLSWRPIDNAGSAIVVHDLRVMPGPDARHAARPLWNGVESFARFYGFEQVLALTGPAHGLIDPTLTPARGWMTVDAGEGGTRLVAHVLQGPLDLPRLPHDWCARAAALGPGAVVQTTGESCTLERRAWLLIKAAAARGVSVRREILSDPDTARARAVSPSALFSVVVDGQRIAGPEMSDTAIVYRICAMLRVEA